MVASELLPSFSLTIAVKDLVRLCSRKHLSGVKGLRIYPRQQPRPKAFRAKTCIVANNEDRNHRCPRRTPYRPRHRRSRPAHPPIEHLRAKPRRRLPARLQLLPREQSGTPFAGTVSRGARRRLRSHFVFLRTRRGHGGGAGPRTGRPHRGPRRCLLGIAQSHRRTLRARRHRNHLCGYDAARSHPRRHAARDAPGMARNPVESR